jgi:outer membrane protein assembly factor BamA
VLLTTSAMRSATYVRSLVAATGVLLGASGADAQETPSARRPLVSAVTFRGVKSIDIDELKQGLATKPTECRSLFYQPICWISKGSTFTLRRHLEPEEVPRDVIRMRLFYWRRGYRDAVVTSRIEPKGGAVQVVFEVQENAPTIVERIDVQQSDTVLPRSAIDRAMLVKAGAPLDMIAADSTVLLLKEQLWERGFADALVQLDTARISDALNRGPLTFTIQTGVSTTVAGIEIEGNRKVRDGTIQKLLTFGPGDLFRRSDVLDSQRDLFLSGMFTEVEVQAQTRVPGQKDVFLRVTEAPPNQLLTSVGFSTADFVQVQSEFTRYNFLGAARRLTIRGTVSNLMAAQLNGQGVFYDVTNGAEGSERDRFLSPTWSASVEMTQPWLFSPRNQLGLSLFGHRRLVPGIVSERGTGATAAITREFRPGMNSTLGYTYELNKVDASDVYFCVTFGVCDVVTIGSLAEQNTISPVSSVTQLDRTDDPFKPTRGYRASLDVEYASNVTQSDFRYMRTELRASTYFAITRRSVLAGQIRLGGVRAFGGSVIAQDEGSPVDRVIHPRKRFYAGGSHSVRGYGENQLGPRVLTVDPFVLTDTSKVNACTSQSIADLSCDPNIAGVNSNAFEPRPLGGTTLIEGSVEFRFPLLVARGLDGAVFLDGALVGVNAFSDVLNAAGSITPGFGVRFDTPAGPVRLDLGIRPTLADELRVITQVSDSGGNLSLVTLRTPRRYDPLDRGGNFFNQILNRLMLHLAIGPAF